MDALLKTLLIPALLLLGGCFEANTDKESTAKAMEKIPKDMQIFSGYSEAMDKAKNIGGSMQERAEAQRKILENI